ncbi:MAG: NAD(P)H-hydrate dehydratase [Pseudomonadota bacterium]
MIELLTAAQMRAIERSAMASGAATGRDLMERAGQGVVDAIFEIWPEFRKAPQRAVIFCGPGNNGGDGFVIARRLREQHWDINLFFCGDVGKLPPDARFNHDRWVDLGPVQPWDGAAVAAAEADLYIDALFGAGLTRALGTDLMEPLTALYTSGRTIGRLVAVDAPSGLCMDSGRVLQSDYGAVYASLTVSFHRPRPGHFLEDGPFHCGTLRMVDIGLSQSGPDPALTLVDAPVDVDLEKLPGAHKYDHGHALILSGGPGKGGAARLAARGALRIGAGLVTLGCPPEAQTEHAAQLNAVMVLSIADAPALQHTLTDGRLNALCLGPGLGVGESTVALVDAALAADRATVLDADALTSFAEDPGALFSRLHSGCLLTPHLGEFARLFPDIAAQFADPATSGPAYSRVDATRAAARRAGCTVLLKGDSTVIAEPGGGAAIHSASRDRAAPWLATAGSGDVLAGFATGLMARGLKPFEAAEIAAWLHVECALTFGPGLIAEDLPEQLPKVFRALDL